MILRVGALGDPLAQQPHPPRKITVDASTPNIQSRVLLTTGSLATNSVQPPLISISPDNGRLVFTDAATGTQNEVSHLAKLGLGNVWLGDRRSDARDDPRRRPRSTGASTPASCHLPCRSAAPPPARRRIQLPC
jgi:hypothetical protein